MYAWKTSICAGNQIVAALDQMQEWMAAHLMRSIISSFGLILILTGGRFLPFNRQPTSTEQTSQFLRDGQLRHDARGAASDDHVNGLSLSFAGNTSIASPS